MFSIFKKITWFIKVYRKKYIVALIFLGFSYGFMLIPPWMIGHLTDAINKRSISFERLLIELALFLLIIVLIYITNYFWAYYLFMGSDQMRRDTRRRLMQKFLQQTPIFYEKNSTGSLMGKSTNDVSALGDFAGFGIMALVDATLYPLAIIFIMGFSIDWKLTLFSILPLPLLILITKVLEDKIELYFKRSQEAFDHMNEKVLENVSGVRVIRSYVKEEQEKRTFHEVASKLFEADYTFQKLIAIFNPISRAIPGLSFIIALLIGSTMISSGTLSLGEFISFTIFLNMLVWPMFAFGEYIVVAEQATTAMDRIQEIFDYEEEVKDEKNALDYGGGKTLRFSHFDFSYPNANFPVLKDISLTLKPGETLGIVGKIGSGKTTLVKQLLHLYPLKKRSLFLGEEPIERYSIKSLRSSIGYVPQQHQLFSKTIRENVQIGSKKPLEGDVESALEKAAFNQDLSRLPKGLDTLTGEKGIALSGGQKQRISIARALIRDPEILILDDSLSAVDANTETTIIENIQKERKGKTNIIIAHRLSALSHADQIIVLEKGRIIGRGTHSELISREGWYKEQHLHQQLEGDDYED